MVFLHLKLHGCGIPVSKTILKQGRTTPLLLFTLSSFTITLKWFFFYKHKAYCKHCLVNKSCLLFINIFFSGQRNFFSISIWKWRAEWLFSVAVWVYLQFTTIHACNIGPEAIIAFAFSWEKTMSCKVHTLSHGQHFLHAFLHAQWLVCVASFEINRKHNRKFFHYERQICPVMCLVIGSVLQAKCAHHSPDDI